MTKLLFRTAASAALIALAGCTLTDSPRSDAPNRDTPHYVAGQISEHAPSESMLSNRPLSDAQLTAVLDWINGLNDCGRFSMDIPDTPTVQITLQDSKGGGAHLDVFQRRDGSANAFLYEGNRIAPQHCSLDASDFGRLETLLK